MFTYIAVMFLGLFGGYLFRNMTILQKLAKPINWNILLLLFIMGIGIGGNKTILQNFSTLGVHALSISLAATMGSVLLGTLVYKTMFKKKRDR